MDKNFIIINGIIFNESTKTKRIYNSMQLNHLIISNDKMETNLYFHNQYFVPTKRPRIQSIRRRYFIKKQYN